MNVRIAGEGGAILWGWKRAATLGAWSYDNGWLSAAIVESNSFALSQTPLTWVIPNGEKPPTRRQLELVSVAGGRLNAQVGKKA